MIAIMARVNRASVPGRMGSFFGVIGYAAILCLVFSLVESQLILPAHLAHRRLRPKRGTPNPFVARWNALQSGLSTWLEQLGDRRYRGFLEHAIEWRYAVVVAAVGMLVLTSALFASGRMRYQFFPQVQGNVALSPGISATVGVNVKFEQAVPDSTSDILFEADLDGDGETDTIATTGLKSGDKAYLPLLSRD